MAPRVRNRTECGLEYDRSGDEDLIQRSVSQGSIDGGVAVSWANLLRMLRPASFGEGLTAETASHVITCHVPTSAQSSGGKD
jgi:hypothetical protein